MKENIKIYSCSLYPAQINKKLSVEVVNLNEIQDFDFDKDLLSIVLFEWNDYQKIAKRLKTFRDKNISLICIDDDISPDNRITLLNNDIEFISHKKFVQLGSDELNQWVKHAKYKVLIIEDNQALALNEAKLLRDSKFIVEISSPDSMSNLFDIGFAPDLILLDLNKTKDSDVADCVFSLTKHYENIPVLAMSDVQRPQQNNQLKSIGVDEILARNSQVDALISKILEMIQRKITHSSHSVRESEKIYEFEIDDDSFDELSHFITANGTSDRSSVIWLKVANKVSLQQKVGFSGFNKIHKTLHVQLPDFGFKFDIKRTITDGITVLASDDMSRQQTQDYLNEVFSWVSKTYFNLHKKNITVALQAFVLTDLSHKSNKNMLINEAERLILNPKHNENIQYIAESEERKKFYLTKTKLINAIRQQSFKWLYQSILNAKNDDMELFQVMLRVISHDGSELQTLDYFNVANETGLLKILDRYTLKQALSVIQDGEEKGVKRYILINQSISDYESAKHRQEVLENIQGHNIPESRLFFQFRQDLSEDHLSVLDEISQDLKGSGIGICISEFDGSDKSWEIAKLFNADWIRLKPFSKDSEVLHSNHPDFVGNQIKKAQSLGYKVIVPNIDSADFTAQIWNLNADFIHGNFVQSPVPDIKYIENDQ